MNPIDIRGLVVRRPTFTLGPVSFTLDAGSRTALVGPSGCGKTTLLRCIAGLHRPDDGEIEIGDRLADGGRHHLPPRDRRIGFVFQDGGLWPHMTARAHIRFANPALDGAAVTALLEQVQLGDRVDARPGELSGGEAQRLALARALAGNPEILLLDEPLHSVDAPLRGQLGLLIRRIAEERGLTLLLVTHDRNEALAVADDLLVMKDGRILEAGSAADLLRAPKTAFGAAFLTDAACLPVRLNGRETVDTLFGPVPAPHDRDRPHALVLLPGDVRTADSARTTARVVAVQQTGTGTCALVDCDGQSLVVACGPDVIAGSSIGLELCVPARILPLDADAGGTA